MPNVVDLHSAADSRDIVHQAVEMLSDGQLVVLPANGSYSVAGLCLQEEMLQRLNRTAIDSQLSVTFGRGDEVLDYLPAAHDTVRRLIKRAWPGRLEICVPTEDSGGLLNAWPEAVRAAVLRDGWLRLRSPAEKVVQEILRLASAPLLMTTTCGCETQSAVPRGAGRDSPELGKPAAAPSAVGLEEILAAAKDEVGLYIDAGPCQDGNPCSTVAVRHGEWQIVQNGVFSPGMVARMASRVVIFVCTGNTCRSPMAEAMFRKFLSDRLQCPDEELPGRGFVVLSAGLSAADGMPAAPEAVEQLGMRGIDLGSHSSRPVTAEMLDQADHIYTMTASHREMILSARPELADRTELLSCDARDIPDPYAGTAEDYARCREEIEKHLLQLLDRWLPSNS